MVPMDIYWKNFYPPTATSVQTIMAAALKNDADLYWK
jgi:hypothetical protein